MAWAGQFRRDRLKQLFLVHGEPGPIDTLATKLTEAGIGPVTAPVRGQSFDL